MRDLATINRTVIASLRQTLAALGPGALDALEHPECRAAVVAFVDACSALERAGVAQQAAANAFRGTDASAAALQDALGNSQDALRRYRISFKAVSEQATWIALDSVGLGNPQ